MSVPPLTRGDLSGIHLRCFHVRGAEMRGTMSSEGKTGSEMGEGAAARDASDPPAPPQEKGSRLRSSMSGPEKLSRRERLSRYSLWISLVLIGIASFSVLEYALIVPRVIERFEVGYTRHLQRAVTVTDPVAVVLELEQAIRYAELNGLVQGNTSDPPTPANDLLAWQRVLIASAASVVALPPDASVIERRLVLGRMREALVDPASGGLRTPEGISTHPHNRLYWYWISGSYVLALIGCIGLFLRRFIS